MAVDLSRFKKTVTSPFTGQDYEIVRVSQRDLFERLGLIPLLLAETVKEKLQDEVSLLKRVSAELQRRLENREDEEKAARFLLETGVKAPLIWFGAEKETPADQIPYGYLGDDKYFLVGEITSFAFGLDHLKSDKFFRGADGGASGPSGTAVRPEAVVTDAQ